MSTPLKILFFGVTPLSILILIVAVVASSDDGPAPEDPNEVIDRAEAKLGEADELYREWQRLRERDAPDAELEEARQGALAALEEADGLVRPIWEEHSSEGPTGRQAHEGYEHLNDLMSRIQQLRGYIIHDSGVGR